jgi:hypothetical protein
MTPHRHPLAAVTLCAGALGALLAFGCGDVTSNPSDQPGDTSVASADPPSFAGDASATVPVDLLGSCATDLLEGATCTQAGLTCEVGTSPDSTCNTTLVCTPAPLPNGALIWVSRPSVLCPSYACPDRTTSIDTVAAQPCTLPETDAGPVTNADELVCPMSDGVCACSTGVDAAHAHARVWVCIKPSVGCNVDRPVSGQSCGSGSTNKVCDYGSCDFKHGVRMECDGVAWRPEGATCN